MNQCICTSIIDRHFSESGIVRLIREYGAEYDAIEIERFLGYDDIGIIPFDWYWNELHVHYIPGSIQFKVQHGFGGVIECDPNDVPYKLKTLSREDIVFYVHSHNGLDSDDIDDIHIGLAYIGDVMQNELIHKCHNGITCDLRDWL